MDKHFCCTCLNVPDGLKTINKSTSSICLKISSCVGQFDWNLFQETMYICKKCEKNLNVAYDFKIMCLTSISKLKKYYKYLSTTQNAKGAVSKTVANSQNQPQSATANNIILTNAGVPLVIPSISVVPQQAYTGQPIVLWNPLPVNTPNKSVVLNAQTNPTKERFILPKYHEISKSVQIKEEANENFEIDDEGVQCAVIKQEPMDQEDTEPEDMMFEEVYCLSEKNLDKIENILESKNYDINKCEEGETSISVEPLPHLDDEEIECSNKSTIADDNKKKTVICDRCKAKFENFDQIKYHYSFSPECIPSEEKVKVKASKRDAAKEKKILLKMKRKKAAIADESTDEEDSDNDAVNKKTQFFCKSCKSYKTNIRDFADHYKSFPECGDMPRYIRGIKRAKCKRCLKMFATKGTLKIHQKKCNKSVNNKKREVKRKISEHRCPFCKFRIFNVKLRLIQHMKYCQDRPLSDDETQDGKDDSEESSKRVSFSKDIIIINDTLDKIGNNCKSRNIRESENNCKTSNKIQKDLAKESVTEKVHTEPVDQENEFTCSYCSQSFSTIHDIHVHVKETHLYCTTVQFKCHLCSKFFDYMQKYYQHLLKHYNYLLCTSCSNRLTNYSDVVTHMEEYHDKNEVVKCVTCRVDFDDYALLKVHYMRHLENIVFKCHICTSSFNNQEMFVGHVVNHFFFYTCCCKKKFANFEKFKDHLISKFCLQGAMLSGGDE